MKTDFDIFQLPPSPLLSQGENIEFCDETTVEHLDCAGKHSKAFNFKESPYWYTNSLVNATFGSWKNSC